MVKLNINRILVFAGAVTLVFILSFFIWWNKSIDVINTDHSTVSGNLSVITGLECDNYNRRPIAVMLASDPVARPLSGIGQADIVFEMTVTPDGITRTMAVFQCLDSGEIGSVRSARNGFIPMANSLGAIFVHWGGERTALEKLDDGVIDNVDALKYEGTVFYRRAQILPPHNGFTNIEKILKISEDLDYRLTNFFEGYPHKKEIGPKNIANLTNTIFIDYEFPYNVKWVYDEEEGVYKRERGGLPEIDGNNGEQVTARVIVLIDAESKVLNKDYLDVDVSGQGKARIYQGGIVVSGTWEKDKSDINSKLYFYNDDGEEIQFLPGKIWIEIVI